MATPSYRKSFVHRSLHPNLGKVDMLTSFLVACTGIATPILGMLAARNFARYPDPAETNKVVAALYVTSALELLLLVLLLLRGTFQSCYDYFANALVQMTLVLHTIMPNIIITALWAAKTMIDASVMADATITGANVGQKNIGAAYKLLTATMVMSNIFSGFVMVVLFINSAALAAITDSMA